jgi:hypothetical protein
MIRGAVTRIGVPGPARGAGARASAVIAPARVTHIGSHAVPGPARVPRP